MYYRVTDYEGMPIATGCNCTCPEEVKDDLLELILPQVCSDDEYNDLDNYKTASLEDILLMNDYQLEQQENPFPDPNYFL
jgi:hypothetical protein